MQAEAFKKRNRPECGVVATGYLAKRIFLNFGFHRVHTMKVTFISTTILICLTLFASSCSNHTTASLTTDQAATVKQGAQEMMDSISHDITTKGPMAWLQYFANSPDFSMASDGRLEFQNYDSAQYFISHVLVKMKKINLHWSNIRIDPLTNTLASVGSDFHEDITTSDQKTTPYDGYFTGIAECSPKGWQLRNAHWSVKKGK